MQCEIKYQIKTRKLSIFLIFIKSILYLTKVTILFINFNFFTITERHT